MKNKQNKILRNFIIAYLILSIVSIMIVAWVCADNSNWMSYLGIFLGGILGGFATLVAIYFTLVSMKQDVMPHIIPMRTVLYGYYGKNKGTFLSTECLAEDITQIGDEHIDNHKIDFSAFAWLFCADTEKDVRRCVEYGCDNITGNNPEIALNTLRKMGLHQ